MRELLIFSRWALLGLAEAGIADDSFGGSVGWGLPIVSKISRISVTNAFDLNIP